MFGNMYNTIKFNILSITLGLIFNNSKHDIKLLIFILEVITMIKRCLYKGMTPLFACYNCQLFFETCYCIVSCDGYAIGCECGDYYICNNCKNLMKFSIFND